MADEQKLGVAAFAATRPDSFAGGYFSMLAAKGVRPSHGYPANHLPEVVKGAQMEVTLGFSPK